MSCLGFLLLLVLYAIVESDGTPADRAAAALRKYDRSIKR